MLISRQRCFAGYIGSKIGRKSTTIRKWLSGFLQLLVQFLRSKRNLPPPSDTRPGRSAFVSHNTSFPFRPSFYRLLIIKHAPSTLQRPMSQCTQLQILPRRRFLLFLFNNRRRLNRSATQELQSFSPVADQRAHFHPRLFLALTRHCRASALQKPPALL